MPKIAMVVDAKGVQRYTDATFDDISIEMRDLKAWVDYCDPGLTIGQAETLTRLFNDGMSLEIAEDGSVVVVQPVRKSES